MNIIETFKKNGRGHLRCSCSCGNVFEKRSDSKKTNCNKCNRKEQHGDSVKTSTYNRLYSIWMGMHNRCNLKESYNHVIVSKEWFSYLTFKEWALNNGYTNKLTIDRIENKLGYDSSNCKWSTMYEQANNRKSLKNKKTKILGVSLHSVSGLYRARIMIRGKDISLGYFKTEEEGAIAYNNAKVKYNVEGRI